jgi:Kelch motif/Galactose oxidase, central domain
LPSGGVLLTDGEIYDPTTNTWFASSSPCTRTNPCLGGNDATTAILLPNGTVMAAGGTVEPEIYDPVMQAWTAINAPGLATQTVYSFFSIGIYGTVTGLQNGGVLAEGGIVYTQGEYVSPPTNSISIGVLYDPTQGSWSLLGSQAHAGSYAASGVLGNGKVLVTGGLNLFIQQLADLFDPATNTWTPVAPMMHYRQQHTATVLQSGQMLVTGGQTDVFSDVTDTAELYDPASNAWTSAGFMSSPRYQDTATLLPSGKVLVAGGSNGTATTASAEVYDPTSGTWTVVASMSTPRQSQGAAALSNGTVLVVGGLNDASSAVIGIGTLEIYDPTSNTWTTSGAMVTTRQSFVLDTLGDGRVLLDGGMPNTTGLPEFFR